MKRAKNLLPQIVDIKNLLYAFWKAQRGKSYKQEIIEYRKHLMPNLLTLQSEIRNAEVEVGDYHYFTIYDPKERIICAASFKERVLHHAIMNIAHKAFEDFQIYDSYATRAGKGTYAALERASTFSRKSNWYLKLDIRKYFDSIDHDILSNLLDRRFKERNLKKIFIDIIQSYECAAGRGLPIGNLTSQYFANFYLAFLDIYIKEKLKVNYYVRYMDDMIIWHDNKEKLKVIKEDISNYLETKLRLRLKISFINKVDHGVSFLGYRVFRNYKKLNLRSKKRFKKKMIAYYDKLMNGEWTQNEYRNHVIPLIEFTNHAESFSLRKAILSKIGE